MAKYWIYTGIPGRVRVHDGNCNYHQNAIISYGRDKRRWAANWRGPFRTPKEVMGAARKTHKDNRACRCCTF